MAVLRAIVAMMHAGVVVMRALVASPGGTPS